MSSAALLLLNWGVYRVVHHRTVRAIHGTGGAGRRLKIPPRAGSRNVFVRAGSDAESGSVLERLLPRIGKANSPREGGGNPPRPGAPEQAA